jgi:multidrug efflux pump subunit AcrA (membrane-fusion protein)
MRFAWSLAVAFVVFGVLGDAAPAQEKESARRGGDEPVAQAAGCCCAPAKKAGKPDPAMKQVTLAGVVEVDETKVAWIHARFRARIDKLHVKFTGAMVKKDEPLAELSSPDLVAAAQNLLDARKNGSRDLEQIARNRLALWGLSKHEGEAILKGKSVAQVTLRSPVSGHVIAKHTVEGSYVEEGAHLFDVADLSTVWIEAEIKDQADVPLLKAKPPARVTAKAFPKREFRGEVLGLFRDAKSRMLKVRFAVKNPGDELRPGMLATVVLDVPGGSKGGPADEKDSPYRLALQGKTDGKLKELLKQRLAAVRALVKGATADHEAGKVSFERVHQARRALLHARLELCETDKERIALLEEAAALGKQHEEHAAQRYKAGAAPQSDVLMAAAARLQAEIALERAKSKAPAQR